MTSQGKKQKNKVLGELHPREVDLIYQIRTRFRYGEISVVTVDGLPKQIIRTVERQLLSDET